MSKVKTDIPSRLRLAMVGYLNTVPMVHGLKTSNHDYDIKLDIPANCYHYYNDGKVDVALVPVGVLPLLPKTKIITDYCIGCNGEVRTVCLFSNSKVQNIKTVYLDKDSRTSVLLVRVLLTNYWNIKVTYVDMKAEKLVPDNLENDEAILLIGDKVFDIEGQYSYKYDLGKEWKDFTGLSFAFAVWIAHPDIDDEAINMLNNDLKNGISETDQSLESRKAENQAFDLEEYFSKNIDYDFDESKKEALHIFLQMIADLPNPSF